MMHYDGWGFLGMHVFWWLFWIVLIVLLVSFFDTSPKGPKRRESPLEVLQRRYAAGEISSQEYEERKEKLQRDAAQPR